MSELFKSSIEIVFILVMIFGAIVAIAVPTKPLSYAVVLLAGFAAGKVVYDRRYSEHYPKSGIAYFVVEQFPYLIMVIAFLLGYMFGAYNLSKKFILLLFFISSATSYYLHYRRIFVYRE